MHRCSAESSRQNFANLRRLAASGPGGAHPNGLPNVIAASTIYDQEYIRHYMGANPLYLGANLFDALPEGRYVGSELVLLLNTHGLVKDFPGLDEALSRSKSPWKDDSSPISLVNTDQAFRGRYETYNLGKFKAVVYLPYFVTNGKIVEQRALNLPIFVPSPSFWADFVNDRTATYGPYCEGEGFADEVHPGPHPNSPYEFSPNARPDMSDYSDASRKDAAFWLGFSEIYQWPCVEKISSWEELVKLVENADLQGEWKASREDDGVASASEENGSAEEMGQRREMLVFYSS